MLHLSVLLIPRLVALAFLLCLATQVQAGLRLEKAGRRLRAIKNWIDSADVAGCDTNYMRLPRQGFIGYTNASLTGTVADLDYDFQPSSTHESNYKGFLSTRLSNLLAFGVSYRGWGVSYSRDFSRYGDTEWSFSTYGQTYGAEFRIHNSHSLSGTLDNRLNNAETFEVDVQACHQKTMLANVYYVGNHHHFSLPAAWSHTVIQRRSCGSWLAILNYYRCYTNVDTEHCGMVIGYAEDEYDGLSGLVNLKDMSLMQLSIGGGYAYNYVFGNEHCLLHASMMPMVSVWHRNRFYYEVQLYDASGEPYGDEIKDQETISQKVSLNAALHLSFVYNQGRYLAGIQNLLNIDSLNSSESHFTLYTFDWSSCFFFGVRF